VGLNGGRVGLRDRNIQYELFGDDEAVIDDDLINKTIDMIGKDYARQNEDREEDEDSVIVAFFAA
jgi:hypothetical protein